MGINPNIIILRCDEPLESSIFQKISMFCNVKPDCVIENLTHPVLYEAPIMLEKSNFSSVVCRELGIDAPEIDLTHLHQVDRFGDHHEGKRRGNAGRLLRRDRPGRLRQSRDRR